MSYMYYVVIMSCYNQPLPGRGKAKPIQKWHTNIKMGQSVHQDLKFYTKLKNGQPISKMAQAEGKTASQFQK